LPLGIRSTFIYTTTAHQLEVGDCVLLFTDSVTEALDANGELFSESRLEEVLRSVAKSSAQSVVTAVIDAVRRFPVTPHNRTTSRRSRSGRAMTSRACRQRSTRWPGRIG
jgi:hypothetical protein